MPVLLVLLAYWLLAARITVISGISLSGVEGSFFVKAGLFRLYARLHGKIDLKKRTLSLHNGRNISLTSRPKRKPALLKLISAGRFESVSVEAVLGLYDAAATAVASGALRAVLLALSARLGIPSMVSVEADFSRPCLLVSAQGIYSFRAGDIILAAASAALKRKKKEGFTWKSIPLKA